MDGIPALGLWDFWSLKYCTLLPTKYSDTKRVRGERRNLQRNKQSSKHTIRFRHTLRVGKLSLNCLFAGRNNN